MEEASGVSRISLNWACSSAACAHAAEPRAQGMVGGSIFTSQPFTANQGGLSYKDSLKDLMNE